MPPEFSKKLNHCVTPGCDVCSLTLRLLSNCFALILENAPVWGDGLCDHSKGWGGWGDYGWWGFKIVSKILLGKIVWLSFKWLSLVYSV